MTNRSTIIALAWLILFALYCAFGAPAHGFEYDAENDIGLVPDSQVSAARNTERLNAALAAMHPNGNFKLVSGRRGPVLYPIRFAAKQFYFAGTIETSGRVGEGCILGCGNRTYEVLDDHPTMRGCTTILTKIDGGDGAAMFRLRGHGFKIEGLEIRGLRYNKDDLGEGPQTGTRSAICFEVEGRENISTGGHIFRDVAIENFGAAWVARAGYYKDGKFVPDENHADTCIVDGCFVTDCDEGLRSENQQALFWKFINLAVGGYGGKGVRQLLIFNIIRGGQVFCDGLQLCHRQATIFKVRDYNPHTKRLVCRDVLWDAYAPDQANRLTLFEGPDNPGVTGKWCVRIDGTIANPDPSAYDSSKLIVAKPSLPLHDIKVDLENMPAKDFHAADGAMVPNESK